MFKKNTHFHFLGIGGIGMSGIAKILALRGYKVSGCDTNTHQKSVLDLQALGCVVHPTNNHLLCNDTTITTLIYTSDVTTCHPEIAQAYARGVTVASRGQILAELTRTRYTIAVAGSHGKTTTTSLLAHIFMATHNDPTVLVGGYLKSISSNAHAGTSEFLITETDESDRSLLHLYPTLAILTNIDREHLNTYRNLQDITETFQRFLQKIPFYGKALVCVDDPQIRALLPLHSVTTITYGSDSNAEWSYTDLTLYPDHSTYKLTHNQQLVADVFVPIPGKHNVLNSIAALATAVQADIPLSDACEALASFAGVDRRFTFRGLTKGAEIFDDYGHHPTEIECTALVARKRAKNKLILVFQPHRYSRTSTLWKEFVTLLATHPADHIIITDLYTAHEKPLPGITSQSLLAAAQTLNPQARMSYIPFDNQCASLIEALGNLAQQDDLILLQGAGNISQLSSLLINLT